jgi:hypothetical protein
VGRRYTGSAGKITSCRIGVFAAYVSGKGHAFIDRRLCLPKAWAFRSPPAASGSRSCGGGSAKGRWVAADSI